MATQNISNNSETKNAAESIAFTVTAGDVVTVKVSKKRDRNGKGILVELEGNPMGYVPNSTLLGRNDAEKAARRDELLATPGQDLEVVVLEASVQDRDGKQVPCFKLSEAKARWIREEANRAQRQSDRRDAIANAVQELALGSVVEGTVVKIATKKSDRDESDFAYGVFVEIGSGLNGLVHVNELVGEPKRQRERLAALTVGSKLTVEVLEKGINDGKPRIKLSEKSVAMKELASAYPAGAKVSATVTRPFLFGNTHGLMLDVGGVKGFLPEADANVTNLSSLTKTRGQGVKVIVTGETIGDCIKVTRRGA